ncbi:MAG: putative hydrolase or acyltransferase of alpha/beta superfamily [Crocinitomicaceae bacterium]|jgi:pimeloyl-ACP methyl ester carboxylesterase|nr:putative hydrolase or acyltransferase of alpha/beta superfamily [Crocinitomicaceae bacterium]
MKRNPPILLLHGALGSTKQFSALKPLLETEFEIFELDFDGHGSGNEAEQFSIALFTENVRAFIIENGLKAVNIFGYSMGGYVALNLAVQNPELVGKIVTLGTKFDWNPESAKKEAGMLVPEVIEEKVPAFAQKLEQEHASKDWKDLVRKTAEMMLRMGNGETIAHADLRKVSSEVIVGWGDKDRMVGREESLLLAELLPDSRFVELPGVLHPIDQVGPGTIASYIAEVFERE